MKTTTENSKRSMWEAMYDKLKLETDQNKELLKSIVTNLQHERQKLIDSNRELLEALQEITEMALRWSVKGITPTIHKAQTAINNAKNQNV